MPETEALCKGLKGQDTKGMTLGPLTWKLITRLLQDLDIGEIEKALIPRRFGV